MPYQNCVLLAALQLIKRKSISDRSGQVNRWWFVVHAPEDVLTTLDAAWEPIHLQTGWKLELCFKPDPNTDSGTSSNKDPNPQLHVVAPGSIDATTLSPSTPATSHEQSADDNDGQSQPDHSLVSNSFLDN